MHKDSNVQRFKYSKFKMLDQKVPFNLRPEDVVFGSALEITIPSEFQKTESLFKVKIEYSTSPSSSAIQWLSKEQTQDKVYPYMFTQCQAIHARSLVPCMDTPAVKATYTAKITVLIAM